MSAKKTVKRINKIAELVPGRFTECTKYIVAEIWIQGICDSIKGKTLMLDGNMWPAGAETYRKTLEVVTDGGKLDSFIARFAGRLAAKAEESEKGLKLPFKMTLRKNDIGYYVAVK